MKPLESKVYIRKSDGRKADVRPVHPTAGRASHGSREGMLRVKLHGQTQWETMHPEPFREQFREETWGD